MNLSAHLIVLPVLVPLLTAFALPVAARVSAAAARLIGLFAALATLLVAAAIVMQTQAGEPLVTAFGGFLPPLGIVFYADKTAGLLLLLLALGMLLFWPDQRERDVRAHVLHLLLLAGGAGLALSGDLFNIFVFYEIVSVASIALAASGRTGAGVAASLRYLVLSSIGSSLALLGIAIVYAVTGTLNLADLAVRAPAHLTGPPGTAAFLLLLLGFGVKAELVPVNGWVPEVYASAPNKVSAIFAGFVSKLAMLVIMRLMVLVFPSAPMQHLLLMLGIIGVLAGEFAALRARTLNHVLAFSSIAQLGLVAIAFAISGSAGIFAGLVLAVHHALVKPALFTMARSWGGELSKLKGGAKAEPFAAVLFVILTLSMLGVPPLPGFWAKLVLVMGALRMPSELYLLAIAAVLLASVIEAAYLFRIIGLLYGPALKQRLRPIGLGEMLPGAVLGALLLISTIYLPSAGRILAAAAEEAANGPAYINNVLTGDVLSGGGRR